MRHGLDRCRAVLIHYFRLRSGWTVRPDSPAAHADALRALKRDTYCTAKKSQLYRTEMPALHLWSLGVASIKLQLLNFGSKEQKNAAE